MIMGIYKMKIIQKNIRETSVIIYIIIAAASATISGVIIPKINAALF